MLTKAVLGAVLATLLAVVTLTVPFIVIEIKPVVGPIPGAPAAERCFVLEYPQGLDASALPTGVRLTPVARTSATWYQAVGDHPSWAEADWRFAGMDSVDVRVHHTPTLRFASADGTSLGRAVPYWRGSLANLAITTPPAPFAITVRAEPCGSAT